MTNWKDTPEIVEYRRFKLTVTGKQENNAWFVGKSTLREDWLVASASKTYIEECFRQDVDEKLEREEVTVAIREHRKKNLKQQLELEAFLLTKGYHCRTLYGKGDNRYPVYSLGSDSTNRYAVHDKYYDQWEEQLDSVYPDWAVIKLW